MFKKKKMYYCNKCTSCYLMKLKIHPDFYDIKDKNKKKIGIDLIRNVILKIYTTAQQGNKKILWFSNILNLTHEASNTLLKTCEEPPKNTFFFLYTNNSQHMISTLRSRAIFYNLSVPTEKEGILWLKKKNIKKKISLNLIQTSLRLYNYSPFSANFFLNNVLFSQRIKIINIFKNYYINRKYLILINAFKYINNPDLIFWICFLILDAIKLLSKKKINIQNLDQISFLKKFSKECSYQILNKMLFSWLKCNFCLCNILGIDKEILIIEQVLYTTILLKKNLEN